MTFDARGGNKSSGDNNLVFGAITTAVVVGAFLAVLYFPSGSPKLAETPDASGNMIAAVTDARAPSASLTGESASSYLATLDRIDPEASKALGRKLANASRDKHTDIALAHAGEVLKAHASDLAKADTHHLDDWLNMTRDSLRAASRHNDKWCQGKSYAALSDLEGASQAEIAAHLTGLGVVLNDYAFETLNHFLLAAEDGRQNPVQRGPVTPTDNAALQGVVMSIVSDPQIFPLLMAAQTDSLTDETLGKVNVCEVAATAVTAIKTLPQDTKGRVFADMVTNARFDKSDLSAVGGMPSF